MQLTIVIPALNEEEAIGSTIERCLAQREAIIAETGVDTVKIVAVSDGSTDRTPEIAESFDDVQTIVFPVNRGYGAAIQEGWEQGEGELLAFLDADGTCDPKYFIPMCKQVIEHDQDVVLGLRMGPTSKMPPIRRLGNQIFALLLGLLSRRSVRDTASGMRVIKRTALPLLMPLPDGLHFTPAMSARALMDDRVQIKEVDMHYEERVGESKLSVLKDGLRFLRVILEAVAYVRISRLTLPIIGLLGLLVLLLMWTPTTFYMEHRRLEEWMFYRIALSCLLGTIGCVALSATVISEHLAALAMRRYGDFDRDSRGLWNYRLLRIGLTLATILWILAAALNFSGLWSLVTLGQVTLHWSRVMLGAFATIALVIFLATLAVLKVIRAHHERAPHMRKLVG